MDNIVQLLRDFVQDKSEPDVLTLFAVLFVLDTIFGIAWRFQRQKKDHVPILNSGAFISGFIENFVYFAVAYIAIAVLSDDGLSEIIKIVLLVGAIIFPTISILVNYDKSTGHLTPLLKYLPEWAKSVLNSENVDKEQEVSKAKEKK